MKRYDLEEEVDALVIGTGAGGGPLLARLAQNGQKVVALEAGKWHDPRDFATDERAQNFLFWLDERLSAGKNAVAFGANNSGIGVGGSTIHYTAYTPRVLPDDFSIKTDFGVGHDWPITWQEIAEYYDEIEHFIGVSGPNPYPWGPARKRPYPLAPLPINGAGQLMQRGCDALGIRHSPAPNAALSAPHYVLGVGWRAACSNRGFCQAGCSTGGKSSIDVTYIPLAVAHGAEIRPETFVTKIEKSNGKITGVVYVENGVEKRQKCKNLFLCAGAIETPRLLLLNELANGSGQVGKNFMAHPGMQVWGTFDEDVRPYKGIPGAVISQDTHRPKDADFVGGYLLQSIGVMPVTYASQYARGQMKFGEEMREHLQKYNHIAGINILGDCLPYEHNFLELSDELDGRGLPKPKLHFTAGESENKMDAHAEKIMRGIFEAAGARQMWSFQRHAHVIGTAMMGTDPQKSVVNPDGRSHEIPNLYICDNSVFPSGLSVNPALTIMALSLRTADKFLRG
ncbi:GMC family oxidoreductase [Abditibacterium utsteinense]